MGRLLSQGVLQVALLIAWLASDGATVITFDESREGELPPGWQAAETGDGPGSVWRVVGYKAAGKSGRALAQTSSAGPNDLFNLCVLPAIKLANVDIRVRLLAKTGEHDRGGGVVWRYRDANNYYVTRWNPLEDNFRLYHVVKGKRTQLANADIKLPAEQWHAIRSAHRGNHIQCFLDDKLLLDVMDDTLQNAGAAGLWTKADAVTWFDDLSIQASAKE